MVGASHLCRACRGSSAGFQPAVSQGFQPASLSLLRTRWSCGRPCRLEIGDTAGWKPALLCRPRQERYAPSLGAPAVGASRNASVTAENACAGARPSPGAAIHELLGALDLIGGSG